MFTLRLAATAMTIVACFVLHESRGNLDRDDGGPNWIRVCSTQLTGSGGSSKLDFATPCWIRVGESETADKVSGRPPEDHSTAADGQGDDRRHIDRFENHRKGDETVETAVFDESTNIANGPEAIIITDGVTVEEDAGLQGDGAQDDAQDIVTEQAAFGANGYPQDELERRRPVTTEKMISTYLTNARDRLYDKIMYVLDSLQRAFFNAQLRRRNRRDSVGRQMKSTAKRRTESSKKKQTNLMSVVTEPSFERSLMTMSFLVFGVFIIQVIQRLMQTFQKSDSYGSLGNSLTSSFSTPPSRMFNT